MYKTCLRIVVPRTSPAQAGEYRDKASLTEFKVWVERLRAACRIPEHTSFTVEERDGTEVGVLHLDTGDTEVRPGDFLVWTGRTMFVSSPKDFHRDYRDLDEAITLPRNDSRTVCTRPI